MAAKKNLKWQQKKIEKMMAKKEKTAEKKLN